MFMKHHKLSLKQTSAKKCTYNSQQLSTLHKKEIFSKLNRDEQSNSQKKHIVLDSKRILWTVSDRYNNLVIHQKCDWLWLRASLKFTNDNAITLESSVQGVLFS